MQQHPQDLKSVCLVEVLIFNVLIYSWILFHAWHPFKFLQIPAAWRIFLLSCLLSLVTPFYMESCMFYAHFNFLLTPAAQRIFLLSCLLSIVTPLYMDSSTFDTHSNFLQIPVAQRIFILSCHLSPVTPIAACRHRVLTFSAVQMWGWSGGPYTTESV
jgi:hypothetical protein